MIEDIDDAKEDVLDAAIAWAKDSKNNELTENLLVEIKHLNKMYKKYEGC